LPAAVLVARRAVKKVHKARLINLLAEGTGKLAEILTVENTPVLHPLQSLADAGPASGPRRSGDVRHGHPKTPTFGTSDGRTFAAPVAALREFGEGAVAFVVGDAPGLTLLGLVVSVAYVAMRGKGRRRA